MRILFLFLFLTIQISLAVAEDVVARFTPLNDGERFAYTFESVRSPSGFLMRNMTLYTMRNNDIQDISYLFTWEDIVWNHIQFTNDFRKAFFIDLRRSEGDARTLYMAVGATGEVKKILQNDSLRAGFRVSKDGKFIVFVGSQFLSPSGRSHEDERAIIAVYDIENGIMAEIEWRPHRPPYRDPIGGWTVHRFDNIFRIYADIEMGFIGAIAELDPTTLELTTLWNCFSVSGLDSWPRISDEDWQDDVVLQHRNPNIRLQR
jgi:tricorn protease-like protein